MPKVNLCEFAQLLVRKTLAIIREHSPNVATVHLRTGGHYAQPSHNVKSTVVLERLPCC